MESSRPHPILFRDPLPQSEDEGPWVIKFDDGSFNDGRGFEVQLFEAKLYDTWVQAEEAGEQLMGVEEILPLSLARAQ